MKSTDFKSYNGFGILKMVTYAINVIVLTLKKQFQGEKALIWCGKSKPMLGVRVNLHDRLVSLSVRAHVYVHIHGHVRVQVRVYAT